MNIYDQKPWLRYYSPWVPSELEIPKENLVKIFKRTASHDGSRPAIYYFGRSISFKEVDCWSDYLASALQDLGLKKGDRVVFYMQNVPQFVVAQYAVWKAGGIIVPLNPMYKGKEWNIIFRTRGRRFLLRFLRPTKQPPKNSSKR